ncbi:TRAP transporter small permease [Phytohalomonas tamaricis]|uniref:TRAP transporter small permease n=1 Tax=Phytohalomonas tamaricis TaxID=2081032 RepID=UPI000D0B840A|nr:TRAP transporter small permease [Phytohalomonas tamaricis]
MNNEISAKSGFIVTLEKYIGYLRKTLALVVGCLAIAVFFCVSANVFGRFVVNESYDWAEEMSRFFFIWMVLLGAGVGCLNNENIAVDFLKIAVPNAVSKLFELVKIVVVYLVCVIIFIAYRDLTSGFVSFTPILGIPKTYMYVAMLVLALLMFLANTADLLRLMVSMKRGK